MKRITKIISVLILLLGLSYTPCMAQAWVKAGKEISKQAAKAIGKNGSKVGKNASKTTTLTRPATKSTSGYNNAGRSAAVASQYTTIKCTTCSGNGWYFYNGYKYKCSSCSGTGYKVVRR